MAVTVITNTGRTIPFVQGYPIVEVKHNWADDWIVVPDLFIESGVMAAGGEVSNCEFVRRYGSVKEPWETGFADKLRWNVRNWWVRVRYTFNQVQQTMFMGRISSSGREIFDTGTGSDPENAVQVRTATGTQRWTAQGMERLLSKIDVSTSVWTRNGTTTLTLGWLPSMNSRDDQRRLVGNRYASDVDGTAVFGGTSIWNHRQFAEYVLARFVEQTGAPTTTPQWRLSGEVAALEQLETSLRFGDSTSVAAMLDALISPALGFSWFVRPFEETVDDGESGTARAGFEVVVFSLTSRTFAYKGKTLPRNPNVVRVASPLPQDVRVLRAGESDDQRHARIRVVGSRIVVCTSLYGTQAGGGLAGSLIGKWSSSLETAYKAGTGGGGGDTATQHDQARAADRYIQVYQQLGAPDGWDHHGGEAAPSFDDTGELQVGVTADSQELVRHTLDWLPLQSGFDYTTSPATDNNLAGHEPDFLPPLALVRDPDSGRFYLAEEAGMSVYAAQNDFGVLVAAGPNHTLALNHFSGAQASIQQPLFDYQAMVATIAFRSDQRITLEAVVDDLDDGSVKEIIMPDAELWYVTPNAVVNINAADGQVVVAGGDGVIVRDDSDRMAQVMVGAIARYHVARSRVSIEAAGVVPWSNLMGQILDVVEQAGDPLEVQAPITSISWRMGSGLASTTIATGFAS